MRQTVESPAVQKPAPREHVAWIAALALVAAGGAFAQSMPPPVATIDTGALAGINFGAAPNEAAFLGVPYAAPPTGDLRWEPPQPAGKWNGVREAAQYGAACPQLPAGWLAYPAWSEDCLFLNVWTTQLSARAKLPVIVFFHGGSNNKGYSQLVPLGPALSRLGVVVVSANYRLGPLGFLAHPALTAESEHHSSGNYGLLDQMQALRWISRNIASFGGDPGRVTVMGQSSGAVDICLLMASPLATGLFQRAIMQSGDCQGVFNKDIRTPIPYNAISGTGESAGEGLAQDLGIAPGSDMLKRFRSIPAADIMKAWGADRSVNFDAVVDGWIIPEQPARIFAAGKQMRIPVLVGSNVDEATVFGLDVTTVDQYRKSLLEDAGSYAEQELLTWPAATDADVPGRFLQFKNDSFAFGAWSMARSLTRAKQKAYLYCFSYVETGKRGRLGAYHGEELTFLSDSFPDNWEHGADDANLGKVMRAYWTQFAKTGNPNAPGLPHWPAYGADPDRCLDLGRATAMRAVAPALYAYDRIMQRIFTDSARDASLVSKK